MAVDRAHAQQGQVVRLAVKFEIGGLAIDPFEIRQVEILDADENILATFTGASIIHDGLGLFHVDWPIPIDEPATVHADKWYATAISGGTEVAGTNSFQVLTFSSTTSDTPYISVDFAREFLPEATEITDAQLAEMIAVGQETFEWITGQTFLPRFESRTFNGSGTGFLSIGRPIQRITAITILDCANGGATGTIDPAGVRIGRGRSYLGLGNIQRARDRIFGNGSPWVSGCGVWPSGFMNIVIEGEWGAYASVPRQIQRALGLLIQHAADCDSPLGPMDAALESEDLAGDSSYRLRKIWTQARTSNGTGYPEIDAVLSRFNAGVIVGVV